MRLLAVALTSKWCGCNNKHKKQNVVQKIVSNSSEG